MSFKKHFLAKVLCAFLLGSQAQASALQYAMPDFYLGKAVRGILKVASEVGYHQYDVLDAPTQYAKAQSALDNIYRYPAFKYTYNKATILIIRGVEGEPNGFSFGSYMFLTKSIVDLLTTEQLTAVIAHELAHSEKAHNLQKTPLPLEATAYQMKTIYDAVKEGRWPKGKELVTSIQEIIQTSGLALEIQADCIAAQQLEHMKSQGLSNRATDLISASNAVAGVDLTKDNSEDPAAVRVRILMSQGYLQGSCDIF
ncbi:M48 family metalloprotease [Bdellovibrio svalbardensis]|uniref:M48 family metalloprotease n=1 Tax=Bdellovibrio svalbardensis TaxID=2972972 RepID=A0ABT6DF49_9BACT|nr:M48 family metalloprotease [Bdellovibrio svalbardensis]MDG0815475.1 M48 family metalloprotease [Bdellovibrio svalbardensis]